MRIVPIELKELNILVYKYHRHHKPVQGHRFSIGLENNDEYVGACSVGRPVARLGGNPKEVLEVTRLVCRGDKNSCSMLYSAAARVGKELGYLKIQTYILESESGVSLKASGWKCEDDCCGGGGWNDRNGKKRRTDQPICKKQRWVKILSEHKTNIGISLPNVAQNKDNLESQQTLFD